MSGFLDIEGLTSDQKRGLDRFLPLTVTMRPRTYSTLTYSQRPSRRPVMSRRRHLVLAAAALLLLWLFSYKPSWKSAYPSPHPQRRPEGADPSCAHNALLPGPQRPPCVSASTQVETTVPGSELVTGFALLDRLYLRNGTLFVATSNRSAFPPRSNMISPGIDIGAGYDMEPTDKVCTRPMTDVFCVYTCRSKELRFLDVDEVENVLGPHAIRIEGFSVIVYDPKQFMPVCDLSFVKREPTKPTAIALLPLVGRDHPRRVACIQRVVRGRHPASSCAFHPPRTPSHMTPFLY